jgi:hypothetical protein
LNGYQTHLPANMVDVVQPVQLRFVAIGILFQALDPPLDRLPELRTDLEAFLGGALDSHGKHLGAEVPEAGKFFACGLKFLPMLPILAKRGLLRQITTSSILVTGCPKSGQFSVQSSQFFGRANGGPNDEPATTYCEL